MDNLINKLLNPTEDISSVEEEQLLALLGNSILWRESYQKIFGRIASEYSKNHDPGTGRGGKKIMAELAQKLEDMTGIKVAVNTLMVYRQVWDKVGRLDIPQDISFRVWRALVRVDDPTEYVEKLKSGELSGAQVVRLISMEKGDKSSKKCPNCGYFL